MVQSKEPITQQGGSGTLDDDLPPVRAMLESFSAAR
jgi:hypothetical protein